ncbi:MAG: phospholipid/cholesterol/gamma-HCH transport system permease protein [Mycobacterium sp.]|nr:phospholipid/cholesterol/gamma-HCH transport system permease protein [Mycobacterium sp.]
MNTSRVAVVSGGASGMGGEWPTLYSVAVTLSFIASQFTTVVLFGQSARLYQHYVSTFL